VISSSRRTRLSELALLFLRLGTTAFGGPAAHVAMMEDEVVRKRGWLTREAFLDYLGATNLIPGPNSTELAIHVGHVRAGWPGLLVAGTAFIVPAAILSALAAMAYGRWGALPVGGALLYGIKPVVIAVVLQALWGLGRTALRGPLLVAVAIASATAVATGVHELLVLGIAAAIAMAPGMRRRGMAVGAAVAACVSVPLVAAAATTAGQDVTLSRLFVVFARIGSVLFGSGYVLLAFLRADLVERLGWLTSQQLLDATAAGQITPGPVFSTATFIGYLLAGPRGAAVATLGIFLPAFVFVAITAPFVPRLRRSRVLSRALDGVNAASFALMAVVSWQLARSAVIDVTTIAIAAAAFVALVHYRVNSAWLVLGGAIAGWLRLVLR
jgi:chromate transporter